MNNIIKNIIDITINCLSIILSSLYIYMTDKKQQLPRIQAIIASIGLTKSYDDGDTHIIGNTLYIAGTHTPRDAYDILSSEKQVLNQRTGRTQ